MLWLILKGLPSQLPEGYGAADNMMIKQKGGGGGLLPQVGQRAEVGKDAVAYLEGSLEGEVPQTGKAADCLQAAVRELATAVELHPLKLPRNAELGIHLLER